jgi:hypothetical protein
MERPSVEDRTVALFVGAVPPVRCQTATTITLTWSDRPPLLFRHSDQCSMLQSGNAFCPALAHSHRLVWQRVETNEGEREGGEGGREGERERGRRLTPIVYPS